MVELDNGNLTAKPRETARSQVWSVLAAHQVEFLSLIILMVLLTITFVPLIYKLVFLPMLTDYPPHLRFILDLLNTGDLQTFLSIVPHFLYHLLVVGAYTISPESGVRGAANTVTIILYILYGLAVYAALRLNVGKPKTYRMGMILIGFVAAIVIAMPINLFTPTNLYHGYVPTNVYHNPTMVALKPIAIILFLLSGYVFRQQSRPSLRQILVLGCVTILCILAKPNYILAMLPALAVVVAYRLFRHEPVNGWILTGGIVVPTGVLLGIQSILFNTGGIIFAPLAFYQFHDSADLSLIVKLLLSCLFPFSVYVVYFKTARRDLMLNLAWLAFVVAMGFTYLLAERDRVSAGNFTWGGQITLLIVFVTSCSHFLRQSQNSTPGQLAFRLTPGTLLILAALALHIVSGVMWYWGYLTGDLYTSW